MFQGLATSAVNGGAASAACNPKKQKDPKLNTVFFRFPGYDDPLGFVFPFTNLVCPPGNAERWVNTILCFVF